MTKFKILAILFVMCCSQKILAKNKLIIYLEKMNYQCQRVSSLDTFKSKVNHSYGKNKKVIYLEQNDCIRGFLFDKEDEPRFFICNDNSLTFFLSENIDEDNLFDSVIQNPYSFYNVVFETKKIYYVIPEWRYNWPMSEVNFYEVGQKETSEYTAKADKKCEFIDLKKTSQSFKNYNPLNKIKLSNIEKIGNNQVNNKIKPLILQFFIGMLY